MELNTMGTVNKLKDKRSCLDMVSSNGVMERRMKASGRMDISMDLASKLL